MFQFVAFWSASHHQRAELLCSFDSANHWPVGDGRVKRISSCFQCEFVVKQATLSKVSSKSNAILLPFHFCVRRDFLSVPFRSTSGVSSAQEFCREICDFAEFFPWPFLFCLSGGDTVWPSPFGS